MGAVRRSTGSGPRVVMTYSTSLTSARSSMRAACTCGGGGIALGVLVETAAHPLAVDELRVELAGHELARDLDEPRVERLIREDAPQELELHAAGERRPVRADGLQAADDDAHGSVGLANGAGVPLLRAAVPRAHRRHEKAQVVGLEPELEPAVDAEVLRASSRASGASGDWRAAIDRGRRPRARSIPSGGRTKSESVSP